MTEKYVPPHRRSKQQASSSSIPTNRPSRQVRSFPKRETGSNKSIMFFGDSFVRLFGLVKHPSLKVEGFTGASAKGLSRAENQSWASILQQVTRHKPKRVVLCFGSVDVHFSYYYTKYHKEGPTIDLQAVAEAYVERAATLPVAQRHIIGLYPSPLKTEHVCGSLAAYNVVPAGVPIPESDIAVEARQNRACEFNRALEASCAKHGLTFENAFFDVLDPTTNLLKPSFQDVSPYNIHIVWETTLLLWLTRFPWLRDLCQSGFRESLQESLAKYLLMKPWAETQDDNVVAKMAVEGLFDFANTDT